MKLCISPFSLLSIILICLGINTVIAQKTPVCTHGFELINNKCWKLFKNPVNHTEAERSCNSFGATLVTVKSTEDNEAIFTMAEKYTSTVWLGLYCLGNKPSACFWDDGSGSAENFNYFSRMSIYPRVELGNCVYYSTDGVLAKTWLSTSCDRSTLAYICELPTTYEDNCTNNYNGYCYTFSQNNRQFGVAQDLCTQECGNLVSIHSANENKYINTMAPKNEYFIGALWNYQTKLQWVDGSNMDYNNTYPVNIRRVDFCTAMPTTSQPTRLPGFWYIEDCSFELPYICKREAGVQCAITSPTVTPSIEGPSFCNSLPQMAPGTISSPKRVFSSQLYCIYQLATLGPYKIALKFKYFRKATPDEYVSIYDGSSIYSPRLGVYAGDLFRNTFTSSGNRMVVIFSVNPANMTTEFEATFTSVV